MKYDPHNSNKLLLNESWWEGRIDKSSINFCYVLGINWYPQACEDIDENFADELLEEWEESVDSSDFYVAYGTFDILASEMVDSFASYLVNSLQNNDNRKQTFISIFNKHVEEWNGTKAISDNFVLYDLNIGYNYLIGVPVDVYESASFTIENTAFLIFLFGIVFIFSAIIEARCGCHSVCCACLSCAGKKQVRIDGRIADNVYLGRVFYFIIVWMDILTNLSFAFWILSYYDGAVYLGVFLVLLFVCGYLGNMYVLHKQINIWQNDYLMNKRLRSYFGEYKLNIYLFVSMLTQGNTFGSILLLNSNVFGWKMCSMGLSESTIKLFLIKRFKLLVIIDHILWIIGYTAYFINSNSDEIGVVHGRFVFEFSLTLITFIHSIYCYFDGKKIENEIKQKQEMLFVAVDIYSAEKNNEAILYQRHENVIADSLAQNIMYGEYLSGRGRIKGPNGETFVVLPLDKGGLQFIFRMKYFGRGSDNESDASNEQRIGKFIKLYTMMHDPTFLDSSSKIGKLSGINVSIFYSNQNKSDTALYTADKNEILAYNGDALNRSKIEFITDDGPYSVIKISNTQLK